MTLPAIILAHLKAMSGSAIDPPLQRLNLQVPAGFFGGVWCWAALATAIAQLDNQYQYDQCRIASGVLKVCCCPAADHEEQCACEASLCDALKVTDNLKTSDHDPRPMKCIVPEIDKGQPIGVRIEWFIDKTGHFVAIKGYSLDGITIEVGDPGNDGWTGPLTEFTTNYQQTGFWESTFETKSHNDAPHWPPGPDPCMPHS